MKIIHVVPLLDETNSYGGPIAVAIEQASELRRRGNDVLIVGGWTGRGDPPALVQGVPCRLFRMMRVIPGPRFAGLVSPAMFAWLTRNARGVDLAHVHFSRDLNQLLATRLIQALGVPFVTQTHGMVTPDGRALARWTDRLLTRPILAKAATRFVLTQHEAVRLSQVAPSLPLRELQNGVGRALESPVDASDAEKVDVLFLARLQERKGVMVFAEAARRLSAAGVAARFSVVGSDWGELDRLSRFIARHGLERIIHYEGALSREEALQRLQKADVYVLPSVDEPYPMSVLEAMATGTATVCTDDCGFSGLLMDADAALVVRPEAAAVADAVRKLVDEPLLRERLAHRASALIESVFSIEAVTDVLLTEYRTSVGQGTDSELSRA